MSSALLVIDMLSDYAFPDADRLARRSEAVVPVIARVRDSTGAPVVHVDDLRERWACSREESVEQALAGRRPDLVEPLVPREDDTAFFKGQHSAFFGTPLAHFLHEEGIDEVVLTGQVTEQCILYTALDAYVRHYDVTVLTDAVASIEPHLGDAALEMMERNMGARLMTADAWLAPSRA